MTNLHNPITPALLRAAIRTFLALVDLCTPVGSQVRFEKLCALLGDCIIGNVWMYASRELETIQATLNSLPEIVDLLGIGCGRYLKVRGNLKYSPPFLTAFLYITGFDTSTHRPTSPKIYSVVDIYADRVPPSAFCYCHCVCATYLPMEGHNS